MVNTSTTPTFYIETFGCQMNDHDSHRMAEILRRDGYEQASLIEQASIVLVNTCSVRQNPENKVFSLLGRLRTLKRANPRLIIGVAGCVAQQEGSGLLQRERAVDLVFGPDHYFRLPEMLDRVRHGERVVMTDRAERPADRVEDFIPEEWIDAGHLEGCKAYIAIMKGCDNFCSFCVVPHTRGREISRRPDSILREARSLVARGAKEIWLLGQNVNSYRAQGFTFYELLDAVSRVEGLARLRFTSPHPKDWNKPLSDLMAARETICNHLHLPFQAGSDRILGLMNRKHTMEQYLETVRYLRAVIPDIELSTDVIVGFPTESEEDFQATLRVLQEVRFGLVFSFKYSERPGTSAARMADDVPRKVKEERLQRLIELQERINREQLDRYIGTQQRILIDSAHPRERGVMNGRTNGYRPVMVRNPDLEIGDLADVTISGHHNRWLEGICPAA